ncbi:MAG: potassium transporter Kup [Pseudomonadota bacterium]|nr:potassium transporter Kup [Pseudomonadota bacterium]
MALTSSSPGEVPEAVPDGTSKAPGLFTLALGSLGVVFGDIGTSPLYAFREATAAAIGEEGEPDRAVIFGILSLILWALTLIVSIKYIVILLKADNNGEGGTLSLMALAQRGMGRQSGWVLLLGMLGAALFFADATITPAISVLSAVEGLKIVNPVFEAVVIPLTLVILLALFAVQRTGTGRVSAFFGPITALWFLALAVAGIGGIVRDPSVLAAVNPYYAVSFLVQHQFIGFLTLGAVFLAVTGSEAVYTDLGHFGRRPIRIAWFAVVFPALALNYFGQAALVLSDPSTRENPFFLLFPEWALVPIVILATAATVIASQAVISGAYSLSRQAIQLGLLPRLRILFTSETQTGQIYMPRINWLLFTAVVVLTVLFGSSANLASAYGIAVTATMVVDALLAYIVLRRCWSWPVGITLLVIGPFFLIELAFLGANSMKIASGGWVPILFGGVLVAMMLTWRTGTRILGEKARRQEVPLTDLVHRLETKAPHRVPGTAIFLTGDREGAPSALLHNLKHNKIIHERNIILTIRTESTPRVPAQNRVAIEEISPSFQRVTMNFGYMETPNILKGIAACRREGLAFDIMSTSFFLSRRSLKASAHSGMPVWQDKLFIALASSADSATDYFHIPAERVVEIGAQVTI